MIWTWQRATTAAVAVGLTAWAAPVVGHHAFGAEFDADAPLQIEGEVVRLEWVNPHSWIHIAVHSMVLGDQTIEPTDPSAEVWMVEGGTPNVLVRRGLRRECLPIGTMLMVDGYRAITLEDFQKAISNICSNLSEPVTAASCRLLGDTVSASVATRRFLR